MLRRITILLIVSAFVIAVHSDVLKCYMCTSLERNCNSSLTTTSLQPIECTGHNMVEWQRKIQQHKILKLITGIFKVDETLHDYHGTPSNMACAKTIINVQNQEVTIRTCQIAKTESVDPCNNMEKQIRDNQLGKMEQCALCLKDACNGITAISPEIFYTLLSFLGALIHVAFYHWA